MQAKNGVRVPVGARTKIGLGAAAAQFAGALALVLHGDQTPETIAVLATATVTLLTVLWGGFVQAKAQIWAAGSEPPAQDTGRLEEIEKVLDRLVAGLPQNQGKAATPEQAEAAMDARTTGGTLTAFSDDVDPRLLEKSVAPAEIESPADDELVAEVPIHAGPTDDRGDQDAQRRAGVVSTLHPRGVVRR